jgi:hypothetical protein
MIIFATCTRRAPLVALPGNPHMPRRWRPETCCTAVPACGPHMVRSWSSLAGFGEGGSVLVTPTFPTLTNTGQCRATPNQ